MSLVLFYILRQGVVLFIEAASSSQANVNLPCGGNRRNIYIEKGQWFYKQQKLCGEELGLILYLNLIFLTTY